MNHISTLSKLNITPGVKWQGNWEAGRLEGNRQLYDYEMVFFSSGSGRMVFPECTFHCAPGCVVIVPPHCVHCTIAETPVHRWCLHFDWYGDWQSAHAGQMPFVYLDSPSQYKVEDAAAPPPEELIPSFPFFLELDSEARHRFANLIREYFDDDGETIASEMNRRGLLMQLLSMIFTPGGSTPFGPNNRHFLRAKSFLDTNYSRHSIGLRETAAAVHVTTNHLSKIFRQACGRPVLQYLLELRITEAKRLLTSTQLTIGEIASRTGFADPNYFTRYFRRQTGMTPGKYRCGAEG